MRIVFFGMQDFEQAIYEQKNSESFGFDLDYEMAPFSEDKLELLSGVTAISIFANNSLNEDLLSGMHEKGVQLILLRSTGYDHLDIAVARKLGMTVMNVPGYSPQSVAEHAVTLLLTLYRKMFLIRERLDTNSFALDGNLGESLYDKTVGIIGVGDIGSAFARIINGFGSRVIGYDPAVKQSNSNLFESVELEDVWKEADIISLHCPLNDSTRHLINHDSFNKMKQGVTIINTARGPVINTEALLEAVEMKKVRYAGLDVYEFEKDLFFKNHKEPINDSTFNQLKSLDNVVLTPHIAFYTNDSIKNIAYTTLLNAKNFKLSGSEAPNVVE